MESLAELLPHLLEHAFEDTIYLVPFLLITYLLLETLEHKAGDKAAHLVQKAGFAGPLVGAVLGAIPQCGFSAAGAALYASRAITLGTLFAVFLSTSDEMLPLFIAQQVDPRIMFAILGTKVLIGMIMGFAIDGTIRLRIRRKIRQASPDSHTLYDTGCHNDKHDHHDAHDTHNTHDHRLASEIERPFSHQHCHNPSCSVDENSHGWRDVVISAVKHTLQVSIIVYLISLVLVAVLDIAGEDALRAFLTANPEFTTFASALVGLIPNCGASIVITQLYLDGMLKTGAMLSGLLVSAGVGILVLFGEKRNLKQNALILLGLLVIGIAWGLLFDALGVQFM